MNLKVLVDSIEKIQKFVSITNSSDYDIDLLVGRDTYLDAKSLMGILSCNFQNPMTVIVNCNDTEEHNRLRNALEAYLV